MPYYRAGDYYRGDYYRGNYAAGGLFGGLGKVLKKVAGKALSAIPGVGLIKTAVDVGSILVKRRAGPLPGLMPSFPEEFGEGTAFPGDVSVPAFRGGGRNGGRPGHFKKDGTWTDRARPRLNPLNLRALRRANRRAHGFLKAQRSVVRYFVPKAKKGKAYVAFKKKRS